MNKSKLWIIIVYLLCPKVNFALAPVPLSQMDKLGEEGKKQQELLIREATIMEICKQTGCQAIGSQDYNGVEWMLINELTTKSTIMIKMSEFNLETVKQMADKKRALFSKPVVNKQIVTDEMRCRVICEDVGIEFVDISKTGVCLFNEPELKE